MQQQGEAISFLWRIKETKMNLSNEQILEIAQYSLVRIDGAWFMALARTFKKEMAWEMDVEAWKQFSYVLGKKIRKGMIPDPVWPESVSRIRDHHCSGNRM